MTSLWQLKRFEARIPLFKSLDCPLALAAAGMNQHFTRYPPVINHNLGWCNCFESATIKSKAADHCHGSLLSYVLVAIVTLQWYLCHWILTMCVNEKLANNKISVYDKLGKCFIRITHGNFILITKYRLVDKLLVSAVHHIFATDMHSFTHAPCVIFQFE